MNLFTQLNAAAITKREPTLRERRLSWLAEANANRHVELVAKYRRLFGKKALTTLQIAAAFDEAKTTVAQRVKRLAEEGYIEPVGKVKGTKTVLWKWVN